MKLYDLVKDLLEQHIELRNSDRLLIWNVWGNLGSLSNTGDKINSYITKGFFMRATNPESIRRCRQKIQENFPHLQATREVQEGRQKLSEQKGQHMI